MTILSAMQSAAVRLVGRRPSTFFSTTNAFEVEIADLVTEVAKDICASHDWQALTKVHTLAGDGSATAFPLPSDYARMLIKSDVMDAANWAWGYQRISDVNEWVKLTSAGLNMTPGGWILFGNEFQFVPAPASGAEAKFPYISANFAIGEDDVPASKFDSDSDRFLLDERILTLGLIWKWREQKRLDATGDEANFIKAFNEIAGRDKGSRVIAVGRQRRADVSVAYPHALGQ